MIDLPNNRELYIHRIGRSGRKVLESGNVKLVELMFLKWVVSMVFNSYYLFLIVGPNHGLQDDIEILRDIEQYYSIQILEQCSICWSERVCQIYARNWRLIVVVLLLFHDKGFFLPIRLRSICKMGWLLFVHHLTFKVDV